MRIIGLDIHRAFAEAVAWEDGKLRRLGRVDMRRDLLGAFAAKLERSDRHLDPFRNRSQRRAVGIVIRQDFSSALEIFDMPSRRWYVLGCPPAIVLVIVKVEEK